MRGALALVLLAPALAGCASPVVEEPEPPRDGREPPPAAPPGAPGNETAPRPPSVPAPVWELGDAWSYAIRSPGRELSHELVVFRADGEHWWLGVENRTLALEHALRGTNPLLGRIHYDILSPHERGRHAGMYSFPLEDAKAWSGDLFGRTWQFEARWSAEQGRYLVEGASPGEARIALDYESTVEWFTGLRITSGGGEELALSLQGHRTGARGTFHFFRGVDIYLGPGPRGPGGEAVHVDELDVEGDFDGLGLSLRAEAQGPAAIVVLDPGYQERYRRALSAGEAVDELLELPYAAGAWRVAYTGLANARVELRLAGLEAHVEQV